MRLMRTTTFGALALGLIFLAFAPGCDPDSTTDATTGTTSDASGDIAAPDVSTPPDGSTPDTAAPDVPPDVPQIDAGTPDIAGPDLPTGCEDGTVPTVDGCLACDAARTAVNNAKAAAQVANGACTAALDCQLVGNDTDCAGACPASVSDEAGYTTALGAISADYCSDFVGECGYSTPSCFAGTPVCNGGQCDIALCEAPNPAGCVQTGCPAGQMCSTDVGCAPSSCVCEPGGFSWTCTSDCGGGVCVPEETNQCTAEQVDTVDGCLTCNEAITAVGQAKQEAKAQHDACTETADCVLAEAGTACQGDCPWAVSDAAAFVAALSGISAAYCDGYPELCGFATPKCAAAGVACVGGHCQLSACVGPNPAGCMTTGCSEGFVCDPTAGCAPSGCFCDETSGSWGCTADCGGGTCVPEAIECTADEVSTVDGCLSCGEAGSAASAAQQAAKDANDACTAHVDCVLVGAGTSCAGSCQTAVSDADAYNAAIATLNTSYCDGYAETCGFVTPSCVAAEAKCVAGACQASELLECSPDTVETVDGCLSCSEAETAATAAAGAARSAFAACSSDDDCVLAGGGTDCSGDCPASVNDAAGYTAALAQISLDYCDGYQPMCPYSTPDCADVEAVCGADGSCTFDFGCPGGAVDTVDGCLSCGEAANAAGAAQQAAKQANDSCASADDCVLVGAGTDCAGSCQTAVSNVDAYDAAIAALNADYCSDYVSNCGFTTPLCTQAQADCVAGVCMAVAVD